MEASLAEIMRTIRFLFLLQNNPFQGYKMDSALYQATLFHIFIACFLRTARPFFYSQVFYFSLSLSHHTLSLTHPHGINYEGRMLRLHVDTSKTCRSSHMVRPEVQIHLALCV